MEKGLEGVPPAKLTKSITMERMAPGPGNVEQVFIDGWSVQLLQGDHRRKHTTVNNELAKYIFACIKVGVNNRPEDLFVSYIIICKIF